MASSATVYDNIDNLFGGMNGNLLSSIIGGKQYLRGVNITCRGGIIRTRPGFVPITLYFNNATDERVFTLGKWQGASIYHSNFGTYIIAAVSGNVFMIDVDTGVVANATATTGRFNEIQDRLYFCQVEQFFIIQDGVNLPMIIDGGTVSLAPRTGTDNFVPTGTIMAYGHGRLFIKVGFNQFVAGDINQPTLPQNVLKFTETLAKGDTFGLPKDLGAITGMTFSQNFDSSDGQGPLVVMCQNGSDTFAVYNPRDFWLTNDISRVQLRGVGSASPDCLVVTGDDLFFRSYTGLASYNLFKTSDRRYQDMSEELYPFETLETIWARTLCSGALFDNRVLFTMVAEKVNAKTIGGDDIDDFRFKALGVLDLAPLNGLSEAAKSRLSVYDGVWTGPCPTTILTGNFEDEPRCFVFGKTDGGLNVLYELGTEPANDCEDTKVNCRLYPKYNRFFAYPPGGNPVEQTFTFKRLERAAMYVSRFEGTVDFKLLVRPDGRTDFKQISEMTIRSPMVDAEPPYKDITGGVAQARAKITFPQFKEDMGDPVKGINILRAYEYEFCFEWDGIAEIRRISLEATAQDRAPDFDPDKNKILPVTQRDDLAYRISCPHSILRSSQMYLSQLAIFLGSFSFWSVGKTPGAVPYSQNGPLLPGHQYTTPDVIWFGQDPSVTPGWKLGPLIDPPLPTNPPLPPSPPPPNPPLPPGGNDIQPPPPAINPPINIGDNRVTHPDQPVIVQPLPKPQDPPNNNMVGGLLFITNPAKVTRGQNFNVQLQLKKWTSIASNGTQPGSIIYQTYYQDWKAPPPGMTVSLALNPANGDVFAPAQFAGNFDLNGRMTVSGVVSGGSLDLNNTILQGTVSM